MAEETREYYHNLAKDLMARDKNRNILYASVDRMMTMNYQLPSELADVPGVHTVVTSDPYDAVKSATNVLTNAEPAFEMVPLLPDDENRKFADDIESILMGWFRGANRRRSAKPLRDIVKSALRYDEVCFQVVDLRHQAKLIGLSEKKLQRALKNGPYAIEVYNPRDVHVSESSAWGIESVLTIRTFSSGEVIKTWGDKAAGLKAELEKRRRGGQKKDQNIKFNFVTVFDYWDELYRYVWCYIGGQPEGTIEGEEIDIVPPSAHGVDFIPWVSVIGGSSLSSQEEDQREPLLYALAKTGSWDTQNVIESILMTKAIQNSARESREIKGPNPEEAVSYGFDEMGSDRYVAPTAEVRDIPPQRIDDALLTQAARTRDSIAASTVPRAIQGADLPSGVAFSTINTVIQAGLGTVGPYRKLAELALAEGARIMLEWAVKDGGNIEAYSMKKGQEGRQIVIEADEIDPNALDIKARLQEDVPTNDLQLTNSASIKVHSLGYSKRKALEDVGETNPMQNMRDRFQEDLIEQMFANEVARLQNQVQLEFEQQRMMMQLQVEQIAAAQQQQVQAQQQPPGGFAEPGGFGPLGSPNQPSATGFPPTGAEELQETGGIPPEAFDTSVGGIPFATVNQGATFEGQTGEDRGGVPIEGAI